jgi:hypothetical protein
MSKKKKVLLWVILVLAAALYPDDVAFVVSLAGPNISVLQQVIDDRVNGWRCAGIGEDSIRKKEKRLRTRLGLYSGLSRVVKIGYLSRIIDYDPAGIQGCAGRLESVYSSLNRPRAARYTSSSLLNPTIMTETTTWSSWIS